MGTNGGQDARRRKLYCVAKGLGLTDDERIELSRMLLRRDITSWGHLDDGQVDRLLDALEGVVLVAELLRQRP